MEGNIIFDTDKIEDAPKVEMSKSSVKKAGRPAKAKPVEYSDGDDFGTVSCLRKERVKIQFIPHPNGLPDKHVLSGGMAEGAKMSLVIPRLHTGVFVNVLTDAEKSFLEEYMGLEYNALSIYKKPDSENFWNDANPNGINRVVLTKGDNYLDLSNPQDYIKYKILLANKNIICPSLESLKKMPKATYKFVVISEGEESRQAKSKMSSTMQCYKEYGKIEDNASLLRVVIETLDKRPIAPTVKLEFLQNKCNTFIQEDPNRFLSVITDPLLSTKALIKLSIENGSISNRGSYLYLRKDNTPLCEPNEEPTLNFAAKYLNAPKHQDILFALQANLN